LFFGLKRFLAVQSKRSDQETKTLAGLAARLGGGLFLRRHAEAEDVFTASTFVVRLLGQKVLSERCHLSSLFAYLVLSIRCYEVLAVSSPVV
jgi:hypothetical protein